MIPDELHRARISRRLGRMGKTPHKGARMNEDSSCEVNIVGLVSDTHGVLDEKTILALQKATSTIIHAGDVGDKRYKKRLSAEQLIVRLAEGTGKDIVAVAGNVDEGFSDLPLSQTLTILGKKIVVLHISGYPPDSTPESDDLVKTEAADIVVFGHSHVPGVRRHHKTIYINPGSAGPRRFKLPKCVALLSIHKSGEIAVEFLCVSDLQQDVLALPRSFRDLMTNGDDTENLSVVAGIGETVTYGDDDVSVCNRKRKKT